MGIGTPEFDFTRYLAEFLPPHSITTTSPPNVEPLSDGYTNVTVRVSFAHSITLQFSASQNDDRKDCESREAFAADTVILKYAPPHLATNPSVPLSVERQTTEAKALVLLDGLPISVDNAEERRRETFSGFKDLIDRFPTIQAPKILHHDKQRNVLWISDLGRTLKPVSRLLTSDDNWTQDQVEEIMKVGKELGRFLKEFYETSKDVPTSLISELERSSKGYTGDVHIGLSEMTKGILKTHFVKYGSDADDREEEMTRGKGNSKGTPEEANELADIIQADMSEAKTCLGMVDFWPGSVLIGSADTKKCGLIDWEYFGRSDEGSELGMFIAHMHISAIAPKTSELGAEHLGHFASAMLDGFWSEGASNQPGPSGRFQRKFFTSYGREMINGSDMYKAELDEESGKLVAGIGLGVLRVVKACRLNDLDEDSTMKEGLFKWMDRAKSEEGRGRRWLYYVLTRIQW